MPAASCVPHCCLMRPHCFVITPADPARSQQLPSTQERNTRKVLKHQENISLSCKQPNLIQRTVKQHSGQTQQEGPGSRVSRQANGEHLPAQSSWGSWVPFLSLPWLRQAPLPYVRALANPLLRCMARVLGATLLKATTVNSGRVGGPSRGTRVGPHYWPHSISGRLLPAHMGATPFLKSCAALGRTWTGWRGGQWRTIRSSTKARSCTWGGTTPCTSTG